MSNEIVAYQRFDMAQRWSYAEALAAAGNLVPSGLRSGQNPDPGKIFLAAETGDMLGLHPIAALTGINVIEGKPTVAPNLMAALVRKAGHKLRVTSDVAKNGLPTAKAVLIRKDDPDFEFEVVWTVERAVAAGLCQIRDGKVHARSSTGKALPWETYTVAMLKARAISEVCREGASDVLFGAVYTPEELGATVDEEGLIVVDAQPAAPNAAQPVREKPKARTKAPEQEPQQDVPVALEVDVEETYHPSQLSDYDSVKIVYRQVRDAGHLELPYEGTTLGMWLTELGKSLRVEDPAPNSYPEPASNDADQAVEAIGGVKVAEVPLEEAGDPVEELKKRRTTRKAKGSEE